MGKRDVVSKIYLGAADRIADLLNNELFEGGSVVASSDIMELDSTAASTLKEEDNIVNVWVVAKDLVRKVRFGIQVMLFAIEEQSDSDSRKFGLYRILCYRRNGSTSGRLSLQHSQ